MTTPTDKLVERLNAEAHDLANRVEAMQAMEEAAAALVAAEDEIARKDDALRSIREHVTTQPSALAKAIVATCDSALAAQPKETE